MHKVADFRISVQVGRHKLSTYDKSIQEHSVYASNLHNDFNIFTLVNDIAVLKMATEIIFDNYVQPACLRTTDSYFIGERGTVIGWGLTEKNQLGDILTQATMPINVNEDCIRKEPDYKDILTDNTFCAGDRNGTSVCSGDSGGGMYFKINDRWTIKGIVSVGGRRRDPGSSNQGDCATNVDVVFTDVNKYSDWILQDVSLDIQKVQTLDKRSLVNRDKCGLSEVSKKPIGDKIYTNFPWMAQAMFYANDENYQKELASYSCGGVLISDRYVVIISYYAFRDLQNKR